MKFVIHCDACGKNTIIGSSNHDHTEIKMSPIPGGVPSYNKEKKKTESRQSLQRPKMFKCKNCGRGVIAKKNNNY